MDASALGASREWSLFASVGIAQGDPLGLEGCPDRGDVDAQPITDMGEGPTAFVEADRLSDALIVQTFSLDLGVGDGTCGIASGSACEACSC